jgi:hypothetical protein
MGTLPLEDNLRSIQVYMHIFFECRMRRLVLASKRRARSAVSRKYVERFDGGTAGTGVDSHNPRTCCVGCAIEGGIEN